MQWTIGKAVAAALTGGIVAGGVAVAALSYGDNGETVLRTFRPSIAAAAADGFDVEPGSAGTGLAPLPPGVLPSTTTALGSVLAPASSADSSTSTTVPASSTSAATTLPPAGSTTTAAATTTTATVPPSTATTELVPATVAPSTSTTAGTICQPLDTSASA